MLHQTIYLYDNPRHLILTDLCCGGSVRHVERQESPDRAGVSWWFTFQVEVHNVFDHIAEAIIQSVLPKAWHMPDLEPISLTLNPFSVEMISFTITLPSAITTHRARIAVDATIDNQLFGQQAEAP